MHTTRQRTRGQALVEFALAATLIFLLLSAAVDLGLIFFKHQGLYNASLEGASYGSRFVKNVGADELSRMSQADRRRLGCDTASNVQAICVDDGAVKKRLVSEAGQSGGINAVNLKDLNGDGIEDDPAVQDEYITVVTVYKENANGIPNLPGDECPDLTNPPGRTIPYCYLYVQVKSNYNMFFALAPAFGDQVAVSAHTLFPIRVNVPANSGAPPGTEQTPTASPTPTNTATATATDTATVTPIDTVGIPPGGENPSPNPGKPSPPPGPGTPSVSDTPNPDVSPTNTNTAGPSVTASNTRTATKTKTPGPSPTRKPTTVKSPTSSQPTRTKTPGSTKPTPSKTKPPAQPTNRPKPSATATTQGT